MALSKAKFFIEDEKKTLQVHFNPSEYSITATGKNEGGGNFQGGRDEHLSFKLYFDTYMLGSENLLTSVLNSQNREDVRIYTEPIVSLANWTKGKRPLVTFIWGSLSFKGVITNVSQNFTMFMDDGKPVRAVLNITMQRADNIPVSQAEKSNSINWADDNWKSNVVTKTGKVRELLGN